MFDVDKYYVGKKVGMEMGRNKQKISPEAVTFEQKPIK